ncbi:hypothetical protein EK21DRAFT_72011 [Setomelanomma holmii]|uniref:Uncharacterized protein n=1 Tax=Setomelanomma holmii TaxID=210430 RepID=A0A9P4H5C0_9PLEO|nr:hypothetical protein EK21DRAFT_72011 [Setomelanomma holmii]
MPGLLSRSKSMRLLKGNRKDTQQEQAQNSMPRSDGAQTDNDRYQSPTPISRAEGEIEPLEVAVRPSTSGGPGDRRTLFHMKTNPAASIHSQNDLTFFLPSESTTVLYTEEPRDSREGIIGIALGSPTAGSHWTSTPQASTVDVTSLDLTQLTSASMQYNSFPSPPPGRQEAPRSKLGRWKSLFRKAPPVPPQQEKPSFYQLTQTVMGPRAVRADSHHDSESIESQVKINHEQHTGRTPSPPTFKANIRASRTFSSPRSPPEVVRNRARAFTAGALPSNPRESVQRSATTPFPSSNVIQDFPALPKLNSSMSNQHTPTLASNTPLLDVSIPDITLERYSVMFNGLLQSNSNRTSNLLVRRQGNAEKLKPLNELSVKENEQESPMDYKLQRRATSPRIPSPSPRLSLFPNTGNSRAASPRSASVPRAVKTLHRFKTAPEKSPLRHTFSRVEERAEEDNKKGQALFIQKPKASPILKPQFSPISKLQHLAITPNSIESFESDNDSITIVVGRTASGQPQKLHLDEREPEWEICSKPKPVQRSNTTPIPDLVRTDSQRQPKVTKFSALSSNPASAPLETPSPLQRIQQLQTPPLSANEKRSASEEGKAKAMVGVARSISVSRANSPRTLVRTGTEIRSPHGDRLVERHGQALTPTMVEVRNRRSQRVQLVDA